MAQLLAQFSDHLKALGLQLYKKETLAQVFSCEFCEIFKNTLFTEHLRVTASGSYKKPIPLLNPSQQKLV